jgi:SPP1 gp7 family putative phage head morphogenesis protein
LEQAVRVSLKDDLLKHQIFIQRLGASHAKDITTTLATAINLGIKALKTSPAGLSKQDLRVLHTQIIEVVQGIKDSQIGLLVQTAIYEAKFLAKRLEKHLLDNAQIPTDTQLRTAVQKEKMSVISGEQKKTIPIVYTHFANTKASEIVLIVSDASLEKEDKVAKGTDRLLLLGAGLFAVQALTLATTSTTQASSAARQEVYKENNIPLVDWVTELDSDVCDDCEALGDNGPYEVTDTEIPPEHWNCRCVLVPVNADE